ncbi:MAG: alpha/beta hydrolase [Clostridia bacterium]|nr:alpha/beta hydrolase [Clostridia bacterium]
MKFEEKTFVSTDGSTQITYREYTPDVPPRAVLQICHGMAEHIGRYDDFARFAASNGMIVCGCDHKGHGKSKGDAYGYFGKGKALDVLVGDQAKLAGMMRDAYPGLPYILLGHSMGSFVARRFIVEHRDLIDGAIICGTAGPGMPVGAGIALARFIGVFTPDTAQRPFLGRIAFAGYNKRTGSDDPSAWLSRDESTVKKYNDDPLCGFAFTPGAYAQMFECIKTVNAEEWFKKVDKDLPVLVTAGKEDPVGNYGDGPTKVYNALAANGLMDVRLKLYDEDRHEILNELDKETVYRDFVDFILHAARKASKKESG